MFHKIKIIEPKENYFLRAVFEDGTEKIYDLKPLFTEIPQFEDLKVISGLFESVIIDVGGYGIIWNSELDLSAEEIWSNGK